MEGIEKYFRDAGSPELVTEPLAGDLPWEKAGKRLRNQIDAGYPVPCLILKHKNPKMEDYVWHWFLLIGYEVEDTPDAPNARLRVKTVTYSESQWLDFQELWETGYREKGGLILLKQREYF